MADVIRTRELTKTFKVPVKNEETGRLRRLRHFLVNPTQTFTAVKDLSFGVAEGEVVGFLGANGSGKSTTIKMLTGILTPTSGEVEVLGCVPHRDRGEYTRHIGVVLGQKSLLWWNIPVIESFKLYRDIYGVSRRDFEERLAHFSELLEITDILHVPVRKLSLGLRMRAEIVASLLHQPRIVFLDEPTIGLDVVSRLNLKSFLERINQELGITIFLTTHNMFDVEDLCRRCVIMSRGEAIYDGDIASLKASESSKVVEFELLKILDERRFRRAVNRCQILEGTESCFKLQVASGEAHQVIDELFDSCRFSNLHIVPPTLESIVRKIFEEDRAKEQQDVAEILQAAG
jgi:viologen exporter family transport system ATP-binding protein